MADKILFSLTTSKNELFRVRERGVMERMGGPRFALERLENAAFKPTGRLFQNEEEAETLINKIYNIDRLYQKRVKSFSKLKDSFEDSLKGSKEYDFFQILELFLIDDYILDHENGHRAICKTDGNDLVINNFLRKYGYPTNVKGFEIEDMHDYYAFWLKTYSEKVCLFWTVPYVEEHYDGEQYKLLFESRLNTNYSRLIR